MGDLEKLRRDGEVAVLVSPGFGAGFSSWNRECPQLLFDPQIALAVMRADYETAEARAEELHPDGYWGGLHTLEVEWVTEGELFYLHEYDGSGWLVREVDMIRA